jgi:hypothetical protein
MLIESHAAMAWHAATLTGAASIVVSQDGEDSLSASMSRDMLENALQALRLQIERVFSTDTALPGTSSLIPSAGHCAAVAAIVQRRFGGSLLSAAVANESHWFNRISTSQGSFDADLTGDQFGRPPFQIAPEGRLYPDATLHELSDLEAETLERAARLASRALLATTTGALDLAKISASERHQPADAS